MRFTIEVVRADENGRHQVLYRTTVDEISPRRVKAKADQLVNIWRGRGATSVLTFNPSGELLYTSESR